METISDPTQLSGQQLSSVSFVWTYLEFGFDGTALRFLVHPQIAQGKSVFAPEAERYCGVLRTLIGQHVTSVTTDGPAALIELHFENGARVWLPNSVPPDPTGERLHFVPGLGKPIQVW